jgi:tRNA uridine 5-carbamoylmethylation protein Kti12
MKLIAVSLIGVPGSGKSTFARDLVEISKKNLLQAGVIVICFDDYIKMNYSELAEGVYKQYREKLLTNIQDFMTTLKNSEEISSILEMKISETNVHLKPNSPTLIVLDDNMYFRSMRQRVRAICKSIHCQHFQIFLKSTLEEAKEKNKKREITVPETIVEKIFNNLEAPINPRTIYLDSMTTGDENIIDLINDRIKNPEKVEESADFSTTHQQQSVIHEADIITRKELSVRIKSLQSIGGDISQDCAKLNQRRKEFLDDLRAQKFVFNDDVESLRAAFNCYLEK